jgi:hypothetical protein
MAGTSANAVRREPGQLAAMLVAALFVVAGVLDVGPGILDNLVHLGFGFAGLGLASSPRGAHAYLIGGAVAYVLLWQFGTVIDPGIVPFHTDSVTVHMALVASMIGLAMLSGGRSPAPRTMAAEIAYHVAPARYVRLRTVPSRPPGRKDRRKPARTTDDVPRPLAVLGCRV